MLPRLILLCLFSICLSSQMQIAAQKPQAELLFDFNESIGPLGSDPAKFVQFADKVFLTLVTPGNGRKLAYYPNENGVVQVLDLVSGPSAPHFEPALVTSDTLFIYGYGNQGMLSNLFFITKEDYNIRQIEPDSGSINISANPTYFEGYIYYGERDNEADCHWL
ncbi:MAG: hypothetical protein ACPF8V_05820, partial [Luteibaculum sp.]